MSDSAKVRLVRCPKCQNLLPELADYSVYQCGGCGAVLRGSFSPPLLCCHIGFVFTFDFDVLPNFFNKIKTFSLDKIVVEICSFIFYFIVCERSRTFNQFLFASYMRQSSMILYFVVGKKLETG